MTYLSTTDTAKLIRKALKAEFPGVKFSVRSKTYSGGSSITVRWTDGPTDTAVSAVTEHFAGATFDGMTDMKEYHTSMHDGEEVHFGADYVFTNRGVSDELHRQAVQVVIGFWGWDIGVDDILTAIQAGTDWTLSEDLCGDHQYLRLQIRDALELRGNYAPKAEQEDTVIEEPERVEQEKDVSDGDADVELKEEAHRPVPEALPTATADVIRLDDLFPALAKTNTIETATAGLHFQPSVKSNVIPFPRHRCRA